MKVNLPSVYIICPHCGIVLAEVDTPHNRHSMTCSRIFSGKAIICPSCNKKFTCKSKVIAELPKFPDIVDTTCPNPECNTYYASDANDTNIIFECINCSRKLKFPPKPKPADSIEIQSMFSNVKLNTPLVSLVGILVVTRAGLFLFITDIHAGNEESRLGKDGEGLFERIKPYIHQDSNKNSPKPTQVSLHILQKRLGFWALLEKYIECIRISPSELSGIYDDGESNKKADKYILQNVLTTQYGYISLGVNASEYENLTISLKWFVSSARFYKSEWDAMFFDSPSKYFCNCGIVFKAFPGAIGLPAICVNCGRKILFRHRPIAKLQEEMNTGILVPKEVTYSDMASVKHELIFSICSSCSKWTWMHADEIIEMPTCRFCATPVNFGAKSTKWMEYSCPQCESKIVVPSILSGCEAVCKSCGKNSNVPKSSVY
ncbi:MAG: hypothetical protein K8S87_06290 [Planctomycetes bacterium]|nr:hypothetical protein [Planctomycetota bacterium]